MSGKFHVLGILAEMLSAIQIAGFFKFLYLINYSGYQPDFFAYSYPLRLQVDHGILLSSSDVDIGVIRLILILRNKLILSISELNWAYGIDILRVVGVS